MQAQHSSGTYLDTNGLFHSSQFHIQTFKYMQNSSKNSAIGILAQQQQQQHRDRIRTQNFTYSL
jgi:hypothetical protein